MSAQDERSKFEMLKLFTTKYDQWSYEEEVRLQFPKSELTKHDGIEFVELDSDIKIVGLILAPLNKTKKEIIKEHIPFGHKIEVTTTRIAFQSFNVVHQKRVPPYILHGE